MAAKFMILGEVNTTDLDNISINIDVRRNFRDYDGSYTFDNIDIKISEGISNILLNNLKNSDIVQIIGRIEKENVDEFNYKYQNGKNHNIFVMNL